MENCFGNYFLGKSHFSYMFNVFGTSFAIISGWSVKRSETIQIQRNYVRPACPFLAIRGGGWPRAGVHTLNLAAAVSLYAPTLICTFPPLEGHFQCGGGWVSIALGPVKIGWTWLKSGKNKWNLPKANGKMININFEKGSENFTWKGWQSNPEGWAKGGEL